MIENINKMIRHTRNFILLIVQSIDDLVASTQRLDTLISNTINSFNQIFTFFKDAEYHTKDQANVVAEAIKLMNDIISSIRIVSNNVSSQTAVVEQSSSAVEEMGAS